VQLLSDEFLFFAHIVQQQLEGGIIALEVEEEEDLDVKVGRQGH
jgi:hypothetical protein